MTFSVRRALLLGCLCLATTFSSAHAARLVALGVALDQQGKADDFNWAAEDFVAIFREQSKGLYQPVLTPLILSKEVRRGHVLQRLDHLRATLTPSDLFVLYVGSHGGTAPKIGWSIEDAGGGAITGADLKEKLDKFSCPVLVVISTCGSGGFIHDERDGVPVPPNVTALCACRGLKTTTNTLDQSIAEALYGWGDYDKDGVVTLGEARRYVGERYREWHPPGKKPADVPELMPAIAASKSAPDNLPLTRVSPALTAAAPPGPDGRRWYGALVLGEEGNKTRVRFLGYAAATKGDYFFPNAALPRGVLDLPGDPPPVAVEWKGEWYAARLVGRLPGNYRVHYIGYPNKDDETVPVSRVRFLFGTRPPARDALPEWKEPETTTKPKAERSQ